MKYSPGLDTVRAFAVTFVIIHHWYPDFYPELEWGALGVDIFFYLSGFLITAGLMANLHQPFGTTLKNFYMRRTLRIFPLYYAVVLGLIAIGIIGSEWPWYVFYLPNHYFYEHGWQGMTSHLWSLAVEEQFYIVWPVMLIAFRKRLVLLMIAVVVSSFMIRLYLSAEEKSVILTVTNMYKFAAGGIFAYYLRDIKKADTLLSVSLLALSCVTYFIFPVLRPLLVLIISFSLFHISLKGWLNFKPLVWMGKISYGIYIFHNILPYFIAKVITEDSAYFIPVCFVSLLACSALSYRFFEQPILKLKNRYKDLAMQRV